MAYPLGEAYVAFVVDLCAVAASWPEPE